MLYNESLSDMRRAIRERYQQKYGDVLVDIDELTPVNEYVAHIQVTISKDTRFVTRYYGNV